MPMWELKHTPAVMRRILELTKEDTLVFEPTKQATHYVAKAQVGDEIITVQYIRGAHCKASVGIFLTGRNFWIRSWQGTNCRDELFALMNEIRRQSEQILAPQVLSALEALS